MLKRLAILAALALATVGLLEIPTGRSNPPKEDFTKQRSGDKGQEQPQAQNNNRTSPGAMASTAQPAPPTCDESCQQGRENLKIQNRLFWVTVGLAAVGFLQVCSMVWQAVLLRQTRRDVHKQAETMENQLADAKKSGVHTETLAEQAVRQSDLTRLQLDLAHRPWIAIESFEVASDLEFREDGCAIVSFTYQIRNVGHSVAQHVLPWIEPILFNDHAVVRLRVSAFLKKPIDSPYHHGMLIFPNQVIVKTQPIVIAPATLAEAVEKSLFSDRGVKIRGTGIELFVCFDYQSTLDAEHHQTQDMFLLSHRGSGLFLPSQRIYDGKGFRVIPKGMGSYAD